MVSGATSLTFVIDFPPQAKQRTANRIVGGRVKRYTPDETRSFEARVAQLAWLAMREQGVKKTELPVSLNLRFYFAIPKSLSKKKAAERHCSPHTLKPDLTNLCKSIEDGCNGVVYGDDSQIYFITMNKLWSDKTLVNVEFSWGEKKTLMEGDAHYHDVDGARIYK